MSDEVKAILKAAKDMASEMERYIDDALTECHYDAEARALIADGVRLGTGIIKGPFPVNQTSKAWVSGAMQFTESVMPGSACVDPRNIFPDPACGGDHQNGRGIFERAEMSRKQLRKLAKIPGFDPEAIRKVLAEEPKWVQCLDKKPVSTPKSGAPYEVWHYHGEIEPDEYNCLNGRMKQASEDEPESDILEVDFAVLVIVNDIVIGALPSWVQDKTVPYDFWSWRKEKNSPWGHGLPSELAHAQAVVNGAWRQVMDHARYTLGAQIVMKRDIVVPQNGSWDWEPIKFWYAKKDTDDVSRAFATFQIDARLNELLSIAKAAMEFADMESSMPQIMGGEQGAAPETVGGMVMLFNNATAVLRQRVKLYDDAITRPHLSRYYDYMMADQNVPDSAKGDLEIDARGSSALLEKDIQNQAWINLANITSNPRYAPYLKVEEELKLVLKAFRANPEQLMKDPKQVEQELAAAPPPVDPRVETAKITAESKRLEIEQKDRALAYNTERERAEGEQNRADNQLAREIAIADLEMKANDGAQSRASAERLKLLDLETKRQLFNAEAALRVNTGEGI